MRKWWDRTELWIPSQNGIDTLSSLMRHHKCLYYNKKDERDWGEAMIFVLRETNNYFGMVINYTLKNIKFYKKC